jgi:hypothetical protein
MNKYIENNQQLVELCNRTNPEQGMEEILKGLAPIFPELTFEHVLTRGGWYRLGGVVDADCNRITDNIASWAEQESDGDPEQLLLKYIDASYFATRLSGQTHFLTVSTGDKPEQFIQLEIEQIQEVLDRPLVERDWFPDSMQDFLDPMEYTKLEPEPVGSSRYLFRRITNMDQLIHQTAIESRHLNNIRRFLDDWQFSSANDSTRFCKHWVLALREFADRDGYRQVNAKPVPTSTKGSAELLEIEGKSGADLATAIRRYDNAIGYTFAWFFMMLSSQSDNFVLADAVLHDQSGEYDYVPVKDFKVLTDWATDPYSV